MESSVSMTLSPRNLKQGISMLHDLGTLKHCLILQYDANHHGNLYPGSLFAICKGG